MGRKSLSFWYPLWTLDVGLKGSRTESPTKLEMQGVCLRNQYPVHLLNHMFVQACSSQITYLTLDG